MLASPSQAKHQHQKQSAPLPPLEFADAEWLASEGRARALALGCRGMGAVEVLQCISRGLPTADLLQQPVPFFDQLLAFLHSHVTGADLEAGSCPTRQPDMPWLDCLQVMPLLPCRPLGRPHELVCLPLTHEGLFSHSPAGEQSVRQGLPVGYTLALPWDALSKPAQAFLADAGIRPATVEAVTVLIADQHARWVAAEDGQADLPGLWEGLDFVRQHWAALGPDTRRLCTSSLLVPTLEGGLVAVTAAAVLTTLGQPCPHCHSLLARPPHAMLPALRVCRAKSVAPQFPQAKVRVVQQ